MDETLALINQALRNTQEMLVVALILARIMPMVIQTPFLGGKLAPTEIKMGLGVMFTIVIWPVARGAFTDPIPTQPFQFLMMMMREVLIGFVVGFINNLVFTIMEMAGRLVDTARGSSMAEVMVPHSQGRATPIGDMYYQLLLVLFVGLGAHGIFFDAFFNSFATIPLMGSMPEVSKIAELADYMAKLTGELLLASTLLSAPILAAVLVTDVVFGILNRVAPQLNAYFMAMPVKAMGGIAIILVIMDAFMQRLEDYSIWSLKAVETALRLLTP